MSSQLSAHAITAQTAMTRISVSRCSTLPAHRGSASAEKCSTNFSTDIATLPSLIKGEPAQPVSPSEPPRPFHALPLGKVAPYGVYDITANAGWINLGITSDTAAFAVESIRRWWNELGQSRYRHATRILITADCGGSNGARVRLWKTE